MPTLNWIGKQAVEKHHLEIPYRLLEYDESLSVGDKESGNLLVQGDNLHALKALLPYYAGKVKCIYIDPPYNTGNEKWEYNDNVNSPEIKSWLYKTVGTEGEDLTRHDKWLCMMYPRLQLLKRLLAKDGFIFISIDDNEFCSLKLLCDEVFSQNNFIATVVRRRRQSQANLSKNISVIHEYILCYSRNPNFSLNKITPQLDLSAYKNPDDDLRGPYVTMPCTNVGGSKYKIITPTGNEYDEEWRFKKETYLALLADNKIVFPRNGNGKPRYKLFAKVKLSSGIIPNSWWDEVESNQQASTQLRNIFSDQVAFNNPKPVGLIKLLLSLSTNKNDLILDSFAGSGTTGHAVMELNKEDGGNRKFILVELEEKIAKEVTAERLKRVINGYTKNKNNLSASGGNGNPEQVEGLGGGFRYCNLGEPLFDKFGNVRQGVKFKELARHVFFSENGVPLSEKVKLNNPLIGVYKGSAYYLLFNGILGDKTVNGGNVLTSRVLESLPMHNGTKIIFGESNRLSAARLKKENIVFKQIPYEIKTS